MKVGIKLEKVKKFGIGWCIPHRMAADNAKGGLCGPLPPIWYRVNRKDIQKAGAFYFGVRIPKENTYNGKIPLKIDGSDVRHLSRYF